MYKRQPDIRYEYPTELEAPVHEGQEVGQASYYINDEQVAAYPIYAAETVEKIDYGWCLSCLLYTSVRGRDGIQCPQSGQYAGRRAVDVLFEHIIFRGVADVRMEIF